MYRLAILLIFVGCASPTITHEDCNGCGGEIVSSLPVENGVYQLQLDTTRVQTFTMLTWDTNCGVSNRIQWDTDYKYRIGTDYVSLINPASMTDSEGVGRIIFGVWQEFKEMTITCYGGWTDSCGKHRLDSLKIKVN